MQQKRSQALPAVSKKYPPVQAQRSKLWSFFVAELSAIGVLDCDEGPGMWRELRPEGGVTAFVTED